MSKKENYIVGLDIGTTKICCIIAEVTPQGEIEIIGLGQSPSRGLRKGVVVNIDGTVESIRSAVEEAELMADNLQRLLQCVSEALGIMSHGILDQDGTIADFQGDAALGFWGWPVELEEGPIPACRAALDIERGFRLGAEAQDSPLQGFSVGIGIVHGRAIAGQIGTTTHAKVGVFGPVVNQGARLEGLTKQFGTSICIDATTAAWVERMLPKSEGRVRRLAHVYPYGMDKPMAVFGLLPPESECPDVTDQSIAAYDAALDAAIEGSWEKATELLGSIPDSDRAKQFLLQQIAVAEQDTGANWDGAFRLTCK